MENVEQQKKVLLQGNEAIVAGALAAGAVFLPDTLLHQPLR